MDSPADRLRRFEAGSGYGKDAAGRDNYVNEFAIGLGPGEFARTQATHNKLMADVAKDDPMGMLIRKLLEEQANSSMAAKANIPVYPIRVAQGRQQAEQAEQE
jgi:hypothetical protein